MMLVGGLVALFDLDARGVQVVGAAHGGVRRAYTSHWFEQVSFEEPIVMASVSPKHDAFPLMEASGEFSVSILAADQIVDPVVRRNETGGADELDVDAEGEEIAALAAYFATTNN